MNERDQHGPRRVRSPLPLRCFPVRRAAESRLFAEPLGSAPWRLFAEMATMGPRSMGTPNLVIGPAPTRSSQVAAHPILAEGDADRNAGGSAPKYALPLARASLRLTHAAELGNVSPDVITALTSTKPEGPRRRFRGKKRYFRRVIREAKSFRIKPGHGQWWDLWHYHADWPGWGNIRWRYRREHIRALAAVFEHIARSADRFTTPFQTWIFLCGSDAGQDATYLHTPNENQTPFPIGLADEMTWGHQALQPFFTALLPHLPLRIGESCVFDEFAELPRVVSSFFIYSPAVGVPLESA